MGEGGRCGVVTGVEKRVQLVQAVSVDSVRRFFFPPFPPSLYFFFFFFFCIFRIFRVGLRYGFLPLPLLLVYTLKRSPGNFSQYKKL